MNSPHIKYKALSKWQQRLVDSSFAPLRFIAVTLHYGGDVLLTDKCKYIRAMLATQGYRLDVLLRDEEPLVRMCVLKRGYGAKVLSRDPDGAIRERARRVVERGVGRGKKE